MVSWIYNNVKDAKIEIGNTLRVLASWRFFDLTQRRRDAERCPRPPHTWWLPIATTENGRTRDF
ncbi:MAG: hypothetical protein U9N46_08825 [Euryarchaeota archaeon]|nr:hypothetical protein [Euryarchaeota archaeon]